MSLIDLMEGENDVAPRCKCESCAIYAASSDLRKSFPNVRLDDLREITHLVYWSLNCARCGESLEFDGWSNFRVCDPCEEAMENAE